MKVAFYNQPRTYCLKCKKGLMLPTACVKNNKYEHKCNYCGKISYFLAPF